MDGEKETIVIAMKPVHRLQIRPSAQIYRVPPIPRPKLHVGPCSGAEMRQGTDRQTHTHTQTAVTNIHFASATPHAQFNH